MVGIDGSPASELATEIAFDEASRRRVDLVAIHAWKDPGSSKGLSMEWSAQQSIASKNLAERLAEWRERFPDVTVHPRVVWDNPADHLLDEAKSASSWSLAVTAAADSQGWFWDQSVRPLHMLPASL